MKVTMVVLIVAAVLALAAGMLAVNTWLLMWGWNVIAPLLWANAPKINMYQAFAATLLLSVIGGFFRAVTTGGGK